jgi:hypothetical protein
MNRFVLLVSMLLVALSAADAGAQRWEITPFGGYRWGGTLDDGIRPTEPTVTVDLVFDNGPNYGLIAGFFVRPNIQIEAYFDRQHSALKLVNDTYGVDEKIFDGKIDYYHLGVLMLLMSPDDPFQPFFSFSGGRTQITPDNNSNSEGFWSAGLALGVRYFLTDHIGIRGQSRMMSTVITEDAQYFCNDETGECFELPADTWMTQIDLSFGVMFAF